MDNKKINSVVSLSPLMTLSSMKRKLLISELSNKKPKFEYLNKKGYFKDISIKKYEYLYFLMDKHFDLITLDGTIIQPINFYNKNKKDGVTENSLYLPIYEINLNSFINDIRNTLLDFPQSRPSLEAVNSISGETYNYWEVCKSGGMIVSEKGDKINIRFDL